MTRCRKPHKCVDWNDEYKGQELLLQVFAPNTSAWIEIRHLRSLDPLTNRRTQHGCVDRNGQKGLPPLQVKVAPHKGAWIEMKYEDLMSWLDGRRTPHGCVDWNRTRVHLNRSLFSRTQNGCVDWNEQCVSGILAGKLSHALVRGLKSENVYVIPKSCTSHPRGCVDWNFSLLSHIASLDVAPRGCVDWNPWKIGISERLVSRTPHRCVDRNNNRHNDVQTYASRTLHGCVDWNNRTNWDNF